jgi:hypothetical protein
MILPSKSIGQDLALLTVGAQILQHLESPATVNAIWDRVISFRAERDSPSALPFWWFALALDLLFSINAVDITDGQLVRCHVA